MTEPNLASRLRHLSGHRLPHLTGAELGIEEAGDEAGLTLFLRLLEVAREQILHRVEHRALERESLHPLRTPIGANVAALHPPHLLRVVAEEGLVEALAEAVDEEGVEKFFFLLRHDLRFAV